MSVNVTNAKVVEELDKTVDQFGDTTYQAIAALVDNADDSEKLVSLIAVAHILGVTMTGMHSTFTKYLATLNAGANDDGSLEPEDALLSVALEDAIESIDGYLNDLAGAVGVAEVSSGNDMTSVIRAIVDAFDSNPEEETV